MNYKIIETNQELYKDFRYYSQKDENKMGTEHFLFLEEAVLNINPNDVELIKKD